MNDYSLNIRNEEYPKGNLSSQNILIEYGDYECPYSRLGYRYVQKFLKEEADLKFIFRHFPIKKKHPHAEMCAEAALCAGDQGKFWEMHDLMFADNQNLSRERLEEFAQELDLDRRKFHVDLDSHSFLSWVQQDFRSGVKNGVNDTPTFFMNETKYEGKLAFKELLAFIMNHKLI
ncbi:MAG: thioredoxin domain-containing protein [Balneola sp.]